MNKGVAFVSNSQECEDQDEKNTEESMADTIALIGRNFNKALRIMERRWRKNVEYKVLYIIPHNKTRDEGKPNRDKGAQCYECEDFGHIKAECPTFLKQ